MNNLQPIRSLLAKLDRSMKAAHPIRDRDGAITGWVIDKRDFTKLAESLADLLTVEALR